MNDQPFSAPAETPKADPGAERRATIRFPTEVEGSCEAIAGRRGEHWSAKIADISRGGMRLLVQRRFETGTALLVELSTEDQCLVRSLLARVVYVKPAPQANNAWVLGCAFVKKLSDDEVKALL